MNGQQIKEYFTPRTQNEQLVFDGQIKQKLNTLSFFALSAGSFGLAPVLGVGLLGVGAVGAGVYCTCKVLENYKLSIENMKLFHAMKKEDSVHTQNYKELSQIAEVINNKDSSVGSIWENIKNIRKVEERQNQPKKTM